MTVKELRAKTGLSQSKFAAQFGIPVRTLQDWERGRFNPPPYVVAMMEEILDLKGGLDIALCELAQYRAAYGSGEPKIIPNNQPTGRWVKVKTLIHAAADGSAFCYQLQYKCPDCGALEDRARKHCPECGTDMEI